jgi:hypothetical protein
VIDQPRAPVSVIGPSVSGSVPFIANRSGWDCRKTAVVPQIMAVKAKAAKTNCVMGRNPTRRAD